MQKTNRILILAGFVATFGLGFTASQLISGHTETPSEGRVTSIGGIFFKAENPDVLKQWYHDNLGLNTDKYGTVFMWHHGADSTKRGYTQWSVFSNKTKYFEPSKKEFMINFRVDNMNALLSKLKNANVTITDTIESYDYGKFLHIMDPEGNKIELWEPIDDVYGKIEGAVTK